MPKSTVQVVAGLPSRSRSSERGKQIRERLLAAAAELIPQLGWGSVSTRIIAERAGVAPGLVHYHFASVQALLSEAAVRTLSTITNASLEQIESGDVERGIDVLLTTIDGYPGDDPVTLLVSEAYLASTRDPDLRDRLAAELNEFRDGVTAWLERSGEPDAGALSVILAGLVDGLMLHRTLDPGHPIPPLSPVIRRMFTKGAQS